MKFENVDPANYEHFIKIGFCQQKFYKQSVWQTANNILQVAAQKTNLVVPANYGRGCGKWTYSKQLDSMKVDLGAAAKIIADELRKLK